MLSTHWMNESEPFERNCASSSKSRTSIDRLAAASRIRSVLPTSPGRTTCRSSMKKTVTRLASRMSSIWALPVRAFAGVKRLVLIVRMRCASSRIDDVELARSTVAVSRKYLNSAPARPPTILRRFSVNALEPVTWSVLRPALGELGDEVERDDRLAGAGPALDEEDDVLLVLAGAADRVEDRVVGDELLVEEHEVGSLRMTRATWSSRRLCGLKAVAATRSRMLAVVRAGDALRRGTSRSASSWSPAKDGFVPRSVAKSAW